MSYFFYNFSSSYELERLQLELSDLKQNDFFPPDLRRSRVGVDFGEEKKRLIILRFQENYK